jgi:Ala-tRNA(Pro) deacylase
MRVPDYLAEQRVRFETIVHAPAFTAQQRAKHLHIPGRQVAKCVLLRAPGGLVLAVLPATHQIDTNRLERELGGPVRLADDAEMAQVFRDCEWGVVLPFGTLYGLPTLLEDSLAADDMIVFESNTHVEAIRVRCSDFERLERPRRLRFASP